MDQNAKEEILKYMKENISKVHFKTLKANEIEQSDDEKLRIMRQTLDDPALFLSKWGKFLDKEQLMKFDRLRDDYEVNWHLNSLQSKTSSYSTLAASRNINPTARHNKQILNRRYKYLITKLDDTSYFSDEAMERREPLLYEDYVGQYITQEERYPPFADNVDLVDRILYDIDQNYIHERLEQERRVRDEQFEEEEDEDDDYEELSMKADSDSEMTKDIDKLSVQKEKCTNTESDQSSTTMMIDNLPENGYISINATNDIEGGQQNSTSKNIQISDEEKKQLRADLVDIMRERFFSGRDPDFDYDAVDFNEEYDDLNIEEQEIHDKYFDTEDPDDLNNGTGILDY
ncbi:coiled-coil domain-containing protein 97 isoform x2 [Gigaspora margarita]|uniref:Coiled-coil domain-containing protein 97 isoform x2 n=1 Tax=Gigaspora margarita TaxID=4874 RepID=A0A8H4A9H7_GIGMA|nr:coiled-coil domain-containing protein 97 isoform x2 [Gigaspora margarita]